MAGALLRALLERAGAPRDRILLTNIRSTDWQSLTFIGERREIQLRIPGAASGAIAERLCAGLEDALADRLAGIRSWAYIAHRADWLKELRSATGRDPAR